MPEPGGGENPPKPTESSSEQKPTQPRGQKGWFRSAATGLGKIVGRGVGEVQGRTQHPHEVEKPIEPIGGQPPAQELPKEPVQQEPETPREAVDEKPVREPTVESPEKPKTESQETAHDSPPNVEQELESPKIENIGFRTIVARAANNPNQIQNCWIDLREEFQKQEKDLLEKIEQSQNLDEVKAYEEEMRELRKEYDEISVALVRPRSKVKERLADNDRAEIEAIKKMPEGKQRRDAIKEQMKKHSPDDEPIPDEVLAVIASDDLTAEQFISNLVVLDLEDQSHQIRSYWGQTNFEKFLRVSRNEMNPDKRQKLLALIEANRSFHDMNYIIKRSFERFAEHSEALLSQHFEVLSGVRGVDLVMRLYEEYSQEALAYDTRITEENFVEIDEKVKREIDYKEIQKEEGRELSDLTKTIHGLAGGEMENWELFRAYIFGRNFFRVLVRSAEHTALSELPEKGNPALYVSSPQKAFAQLLNQLKFIGLRFRTEEQLGGFKLIENALKLNAAESKTGIKTLQGTDVDSREAQAIVAARGVMATWRVAEIALRQIGFVDSDGRLTNVVQFMEDHKKQIDVVKDDATAAIELFTPMFNNVSICLGILVSPNALSIPDAVKAEIWSRVATYNPLVVASLLARFEAREGANLTGVKSLEEILVSAWGSEKEKKALEDLKKRKKELNTTKKTGKDYDDLKLEINENDQKLSDFLKKNEKWEDFKKKLRLIHELRMRKEQERLKARRFAEKPELLSAFYKTEKQFNEETKNLSDEEKEKIRKNNIILTTEEELVLKEIVTSGQALAPDLAKIRQTTAWFLNDTPFEILKWNRLGQFYDRQTGDLANFQKANTELFAIFGNPFGQPTEEILKHFNGAITAAGAVLGRKDPQKTMLPVFRAWCKMIYEKPWLRAKVLSGAWHLFRKPTSRAEAIIGIDAPAVDEDGMQKVFDQALYMGILRLESKDKKTGKVDWEDTYYKLINEFGTQWYTRYTWAKVRDYGPFFLLALLLISIKTIASAVEVQGSKHQ